MKLLQKHRIEYTFPALYSDEQKVVVAFKILDIILKKFPVGVALREKLFKIEGKFQAGEQEKAGNGKQAVQPEQEVALFHFAADKLAKIYSETEAANKRSDGGGFWNEYKLLGLMKLMRLMRVDKG